MTIFELPCLQNLSVKIEGEPESILNITGEVKIDDCWRIWNALNRTDIYDLEVYGDLCVDFVILASLAINQNCFTSPFNHMPKHWQLEQVVMKMLYLIEARKNEWKSLDFTGNLPNEVRYLLASIHLKRAKSQQKDDRKWKTLSDQDEREYQNHTSKLEAEISQLKGLI
jgi:hypothetical protein